MEITMEEAANAIRANFIALYAHAYEAYCHPLGKVDNTFTSKLLLANEEVAKFYAENIFITLQEMRCLNIDAVVTEPPPEKNRVNLVKSTLLRSTSLLATQEEIPPAEPRQIELRTSDSSVVLPTPERFETYINELPTHMLLPNWASADKPMGLDYMVLMQKDFRPWTSRVAPEEDALIRAVA